MPFGLRWEDEGGLERSEVVEGEERMVEVWMRRLDLRVVTRNRLASWVKKNCEGSWLTFGLEGFDLCVKW